MEFAGVRLSGCNLLAQSFPNLQQVSDDIAVNHARLAQQCDQVIGTLLTDLRRRGLLDETLVIRGGEFGRTPTVELPQKG